jgi:hypothetical protein
MRIECAAQEDLMALLNLQKLAYQSEAKLCNDYTIPPLTQTYESISKDFSNMDMLKAVDENGNIIGSVRASEKEGWHNWSKPEAEKTAFYAEYNSRGPGGKTYKRVNWTKILTLEEAKLYQVQINKVFSCFENDIVKL